MPKVGSVHKSPLCVASLRGRLDGSRMVGCIQDAFFDALRAYCTSRRIAPGFYNVTWDGSTPRRDRDAIRYADTVLIMSSNEFVYHAGISHRYVDDSNAAIAALLPLLARKSVVVLSMDALDNEALYRRLLPTVERLRVVSEADFPMTIQTLRYTHLTALGLQDAPRDVDFVYWGTTKRQTPDGVQSGDQRLPVLRRLFADATVSSLLFGFAFGKRPTDGRWDTNLARLAPSLARGCATACFQWPGHGHRLTARYHEALALGIVPLVHVDYDCNDTAGVLAWQRFRTADELRDRVLSLRDDAFRRDVFGRILTAYLARRPDDDAQREALARILDEVAGDALDVVRRRQEAMA